MLQKLFHYGFDNAALNIISDYFTFRQQLVKIKRTKSDFKQIRLGVPQGSILGLLFFIIFINDMPFFLKKLKSKLFADQWRNLGLFHMEH